MAEVEKDLIAGDNPSETMEHAPGWNETLASVSEAVVSSHAGANSMELTTKIKADKEDLSNITIEELQMKTIKVTFVPH